jgi:hypothetical protein
VLASLAGLATTKTGLVSIAAVGAVTIGTVTTTTQLGHQTRTAARGPTATRVAKKQHMENLSRIAEATLAGRSDPHQIS